MKDNYTIAKEVLDGKWSNGMERRERLTSAGYDYNAIQTIVNALVYDKELPKEYTDLTPLEIEYDPSHNNGLIINVIIGR